MLSDRSSHNEVDDVHKSGSVTQYSKEMLVRKCVSDVACPLNVETRYMIYHRVLDVLLVFDLQIEFFKKQHPLYQSWLRVLEEQLL